MIRIIKAKNRHYNDFGWLKTYWLFSFSDYYDPSNIHFGRLRVFNDDIVEPSKGFPTHPHEEMEIITIVLSGEMTHKDSMGNVSLIKAGDVQRMSAGTGLTHSEFNLSSERVHFYQIWILPDKRGTKPSYDQKTFSSKEWENRLFPVASGRNITGTVTFQSDSSIYRSHMEAGTRLDFETTTDRGTLIYLTKGSLEINGIKLDENDQARIDGIDQIMISTLTDSEFILIDIPFISI